MLYKHSYFDLAYSIVLIIVIFLLSKKKSLNPEYGKYYSKGLLLKMIGAFIFCCIYKFYYKGGDTINYFQGAFAMKNIFIKSPITYFELLFGENNNKNLWEFYKYNQFIPKYMFKDTRTYLVIKVSSILCLPGLGGFFSTTIILSRLSYTWIFQLFKIITERYENFDKLCYYALLCIPSVIFWGSGIMKDTLVFSSVCFILVGTTKIFQQKEKLFFNIVQMIIAFYLIIEIKSYIIIAILPGLLVYFNFERFSNIKSSILKISLLPIALLGSFLLLQGIFIGLGDSFGKYSFEKIFIEASVQQQDLIRDVYGKNSFDIGYFEPTLQGAIGKAPDAILAAIYRPFLWEVGSPVMWFSAIENSLMFIITVYLIFIGGISFFRKIFFDPFLIFCLSFVILLAFGVGLSTANFGALVRYKIPFIPFYVFLLLIIGKNIQIDNKLILKKN